MDELNQVSQEENLFDETETETEVEETTETEVPEPFLTIRYNKEDKGLSKDEAVTYAQKGMNYDHLNGKYTEILNELNELAGMNGMEYREYLNSLRNAQSNLAVAQEVQNLRQNYPGADEDLLRQLAEKNVNERFVNQQREKEQNAADEERFNESALKKQIEVFTQVHPGVRADLLDQGVYDLMQDGYTLLEAYTIYNKPKVDAQSSIQKKNESNRNKSLGNMSSNEEIQTDDFLKGFLKG